MNWIYLSPHLDDAIFSCGGFIWEQVHSGEQVTILTVCAGDPPYGELSTYAELLHYVWQTDRNPVERRRREDMEACRIVGAHYQHLQIPDCIYRSSSQKSDAKREFFYTSNEAIFGDIHPLDEPTIEAVYQQIEPFVTSGSIVVSPLAIGNHIDHQITRSAAEKLGVELYYYADYPYAAEAESTIDDLKQTGWVCENYFVSKEGMSNWIEAVAAYNSQISSFWSNRNVMEKELRSYSKKQGGICLWYSGNTT